jgi:hypothetical protein
MFALALVFNFGARGRLGRVVQVRQVRVGKLGELVYETSRYVLELPRPVDAGMGRSEMSPDSNGIWWDPAISNCAHRVMCDLPHQSTSG